MSTEQKKLSLDILFKAITLSQASVVEELKSTQARILEHKSYFGTWIRRQKNEAIDKLLTLIPPTPKATQSLLAHITGGKRKEIHYWTHFGWPVYTNTHQNHEFYKLYNIYLFYFFIYSRLQILSSLLNNLLAEPPFVDPEHLNLFDKTLQSTLSAYVAYEIGLQYLVAFNPDTPNSFLDQLNPLVEHLQQHIETPKLQDQLDSIIKILFCHDKAKKIYPDFTTKVIEPLVDAAKKTNGFKQFGTTQDVASAIKQKQSQVQSQNTETSVSSTPDLDIENMTIEAVQDFLRDQTSHSLLQENSQLSLTGLYRYGLNLAKASKESYYSYNGSGFRKGTYLLKMIATLIAKSHTPALMPKIISEFTQKKFTGRKPGQEITLIDHRSKFRLFRVGHSTIQKEINNLCQALPKRPPA